MCTRRKRKQTSQRRKGHTRRRHRRGRTFVALLLLLLLAPLPRLRLALRPVLRALCRERVHSRVRVGIQCDLCPSQACHRAGAGLRDVGLEARPNLQELVGQDIAQGGATLQRRQLRKPLLQQGRRWLPLPLALVLLLPLRCSWARSLFLLLRRGLLLARRLALLARAALLLFGRGLLVLLA